MRLSQTVSAKLGFKRRRRGVLYGLKPPLLTIALAFNTVKLYKVSFAGTLKGGLRGAGRSGKLKFKTSRPLLATMMRARGKTFILQGGRLA